MSSEDKYPVHGMRLQVRQVTHQAININSFELVHPEGQELPPFDPGAHIDFYFHDGSVRQYSLCSDPADHSRYLIGVLRDDKGRGGSQALHERVHVQRTVVVGKPRNNFPIAEEAKHHLLLAGGIGVTPMMAMLYHLDSIGADFTLHYCSKSPEHTAFKADLAPYVEDGRVFFHQDGGIPGQGLDIAKLLKKHKKGTHLYYCGPPGFMRAVKQFTEHWPEGTVHFEFFTAGAAPKQTMTGDELGKDGEAIGIGFQIKVASTGKVYSVPNDKTIIEVLAENGIKVEVSCESGLCSTCSVRYLEGVVDHRDLVLSDKEKMQYLTPCVSRARSDMLVLDL